MYSDWLDTAYRYLDSYHVSSRMLLFASLALALVFLFAAREAISWLMKTHGVRSELKRLRKLTLVLHADVKELQGLVRTQIEMMESRSISFSDGGGGGGGSGGGIPRTALEGSTKPPPSNGEGMAAAPDSKSAFPLQF